MSQRQPVTLCIDIGGTGVKMEAVDMAGKPLTKRTRVETPRPAVPDAVLAALKTQIGSHGEFERVSAGFPGVVVNGVTKTAPNLGDGWPDFDLAAALRAMTGRPARVANDADVQGFGDIEGNGVELVLTLGTGVGSAVYIDGRLLPNLELGHAPFKNSDSYEDYLGNAALHRLGQKKWRRRVSRVAEQLQPVWNFRRLYLGGGNSRLLHQDELPGNVQIAPNEAGLTGGVALWRDVDAQREGKPPPRPSTARRRSSKASS